MGSHGERFLDERNFQTNFTEKPYTKARDLHQAKRDTSQFHHSRNLAELVTEEAESELSSAKKTVRDLSKRIGESNSRAKTHMRDIEKAKKMDEEWNSENYQYAKVMQELESIKLELSKLKLDMASLSKAKKRADQETSSSLLNMQKCSSSVETLTREIEEMNEENVLVELAKIEAVNEYEEIESQRREKNEKYLAAREKNRRKKKKMIQEIKYAQELETKLAITISDVNMLENELKQVKEIDKSIQNLESKSHGNEKSDSESLLDSVVKELEAKKKELASVKEESFHFMTSMDIVRNELKHVAEETGRLKKKEEKSETAFKNLNSKLLRAKAKLESTSASEEKAKSMVFNLSLTLEQLKSEVETAKKERSAISEETATIKAEVQKTETEIDSTEEKLQAALHDLKAVKSSETIALEKLKSQIENTIRNRASASKRSSTITISKFEYEYLIGHGAGAQQIAEKKIAAARAWVEAQKASEKEISIKTDLSRRETRELRVEEEREVRKADQSINANKMVDKELENRRHEYNEQKIQPGISHPAEITLPSRFMNRSVKITPTRKSKTRRNSSPVVRAASRAASFSARRRKKMMPNLAKFFSGKKSMERDY